MRTTWTFNAGIQGFGYADDTFRLTNKPGYASGAWAASGGADGSGALGVTLGGVDNADIAGMSGGWSARFSLSDAENVTLTFRVKVTQSNAYEKNEYTESMVAIDGHERSVGIRVAGDGAGGPERSSGWRTVSVDLGKLDPGQHTLTLGGFNNLKTEVAESSRLWFDDVTLAGVPVAPGGSGGGGGLEAFEARVMALTNEFRVANGKAAFQSDAKLDAAAEDWSQTMATGDFFHHSTPAQVEEQGYEWRAWGENIAVGYTTPEAVVNGWIASPGHRANMLSDNFKEMGVGYYYLANDTGSVNYHHYWTQVFGTEADSLV